MDRENLVEHGLPCLLISNEVMPMFMSCLVLQGCLLLTNLYCKWATCILTAWGFCFITRTSLCLPTLPMSRATISCSDRFGLKKNGIQATALFLKKMQSSGGWGSVGWWSRPRWQERACLRPLGLEMERLPPHWHVWGPCRHAIRHIELLIGHRKPVWLKDKSRLP